MPHTVCSNGRRQAAALTSMNLRAVVGLEKLFYMAPRPRKVALVETAVGSRFQPRDERGRFVPYADLWAAIILGFARSAYDYDQIDQLENYLDAE